MGPQSCAGLRCRECAHGQRCIQSAPRYWPSSRVLGLNQRQVSNAFSSNRACDLKRPSHKYFRKIFEQLQLARRVSDMGGSEQNRPAQLSYLFALRAINSLMLRINFKNTSRFRNKSKLLTQIDPIKPDADSRLSFVLHTITGFDRPSLIQTKRTKQVITLTG